MDALTPEEAAKAEADRLSEEALERAVLESKYGTVYNTEQFQAAFDLLGFVAPYVTVIRKSDQQRGSLTFTHWPRFYFNFQSS